MSKPVCAYHSSTHFGMLMILYFIQLYIKIGQMMAGERVPAVSLESLAGYHGP
jgi:hypothetical protein